MEKNRRELESSYGNRDRVQQRQASQAVPAKPVESKVPCLHFPNCKYGNRCLFGHGQSLAAPLPMLPNARSASQGRGRKGRGNGEKAARGLSPTSLSPRTPKTDEEKKQMPCFAFLKGSCNRENALILTRLNLNPLEHRRRKPNLRLDKWREQRASSPGTKSKCHMCTLG